MLDEDGFDNFTDEDIPEPVLARLVPKKNNKWSFLAIATNLAASFFESTAAALEDATTLICQRASYEDDRFNWATGVGYEIERVDDFLREQGGLR